jgi:hypothetical protein
MKTEKVNCQFHFKSVETEAECKKLVEALGILNGRRTAKREMDIDHKIAWLPEPPSERCLSFDLYDYALQAYVFGLDIAAVMYCFSAIELMLRLIFKRNLGDSKTNECGLAALIRKCSENGLISEKQARLANNLRIMRNYYIHYISFVDSFNELWQNAVDLAKKHRPSDQAKEILRVLDDFGESFRQTKFLGVKFGKIKSEEVRKFLAENEVKYQRWLDNNEYDYLKIKDPNTLIDFSIDRFNALRAIDWTAEILKEAMR